MQETLLRKPKEEKYIMNKNNERVVFITGSSKGIGRETALIFARHNWKIILSYYNDKKEAEKVKTECFKLGAIDTLSVELNVKDNESILKAVKKIIKKYNQIDVLINNAGIVVWKELLEQEDVEIKDQIRTNLEGLILVTKYCLPYVKESVINISSSAGKQGFAELTAYSASKFGVRGFTQALASEVESKIKIYSVNPGTTATRMTNFQGTPPEKVAEIIFNTANYKYNIPSGGDIDVWRYL